VDWTHWRRPLHSLSCSLSWYQSLQYQANMLPVKSSQTDQTPCPPPHAPIFLRLKIVEPPARPAPLVPWTPLQMPISTSMAMQNAISHLGCVPLAAFAGVAGCGNPHRESRHGASEWAHYCPHVHMWCWDEVHRSRRKMA